MYGRSSYEQVMVRALIKSAVQKSNEISRLAKDVRRDISNIHVAHLNAQFVARTQSQKEDRQTHKYVREVFVRVGDGAMGWLWLVGSIKLYVSFAKEPYDRDDILQKRLII